ncbi:M16 family metallopeptidase [Ruegeria atlantica]|uniref:M16 family metallopeptidase n=1 Tax=Ruegeria atlantica TaxID=81569 RepID=UPI00147E550A|nr:insulinase family protein [Ruegeria atlantica]
MIRAVLVVSSILAIAACQSDKPSASEESTPSGIKYTLLHMPRHEDVTIHVAWPTDWAYRQETKKAAALVGMELILAGGAEGFPAGEAAELFADLESEGYIYNGAQGHVIGELTFPREHLSKTIEIANAHLRNPTLDKLWFERIRDGFEQNINEARTHPTEAGFDTIRWAVFGTQPIRNALSFDDPNTFKTLEREDVVRWHQEIFTRQPEAIVVAGSLNAAEAGSAVDSLLAGLTETKRPIGRDVKPNFAPRRIVLHKPDAQTTSVTFIAPLPPSRLGSEFEDLILIDVLGGGDQSILFDTVRTQLRASYGFDAGISDYSRELRFLYMTGEVETALAAKAERSIVEAYKDFKLAGANESISIQKDSLEKYVSDLGGFVVDQAQVELQFALNDLPPGSSLKLSGMLSEVSKKTVNNRLHEYFPSHDQFIIVATSPDADALPGACIISTPQDALNCP